MYLTTEFYPQQDSDSNPSCGNSRFNSFERRILAFASAEVHCLFPVVVYMREIPSGTFSPLTLLNHSGVCGSLLFSCGFCRTPPSLIYLPVPSIFRVLSLRQEPYAAHVVLATSCVFTSRALRRTQCTRNPSRLYVFFFLFFFFLISLSRFFSNRATTPLLTLLTRDTLTTCCLPLWSLVNRRTPTCESEISPGKGLRSLLGGLPWPRSSLISFSPAGVVRYVEIRLEGPK